LVGGATGEAGAELLPDHPLLGRALGFLFGAHAASTAANTVAKTGAMVTGTGETTPLFQSYERQGVPTTLTGDVTQNPLFQRLQSIATKMPGGEQTIRTAANDAADAWQAAAERTASQLGLGATMAEAGNSLQQFKQTSTDKWNVFRGLVPQDTPIQVNGFQTALRGVNQDFGGADHLAKALQPQLGTKLSDALAADISPTGTLPWQAVQAVRTRLGELLESGQPISDMANSAIKRLYAGLSDDMRTGANAAGPQASRAFNDANAYTATGHTLLDDHLTPILNATNPEQAAQYALAQVKQGGGRLSAIQFATPGQPANLGATMIRQAADQGPATALATRLKNVSPEAQRELFNAPGAPQNVQDLVDIAKAQRATVQGTGNVSNTSAHYSTGLGRVVTAMEMARAGREYGGLPGAVAGGTLGFFAPNAVGLGARMFINPLMSRIYSTDVTPFGVPGAISPNMLLQMQQPDRQNQGARLNPLLR
jgi:hypothetical protein